MSVSDAYCDVPGCGGQAKLFGPGGRRCLSHAHEFAPEAPAPCGCEESELLRQERDEALERVQFLDGDECARQLAEAATLRAERAAAEEYIAQRDAARADLAAIQATHDAAHALLDDALERIARTERVLENWPADGAFALRVLRGEKS